MTQTEPRPDARAPARTTRRAPVSTTRRAPVSTTRRAPACTAQCAPLPAGPGGGRGGACLAMAAALLALALPARAEIAAQELYAHWQAQAEEQGRAVAAETASPTGEGLALTGLSITQTFDGDMIRLDVPRLDLVERDGGVDVALTAGERLSLRIDPRDAAATELVLELSEGPLRLRATGDLPAPAYTLAAETLGLALVSLEGPDAPESAEWAASVAGLAGNLTGGGAEPLLADLQATRAGLDLAVSEAGARLVTSLAQSALTTALAFRPGDADGRGWGIDLRSASGASTALSRQVGPDGEAFETESRQASTRVSVALSSGRRDLATAATGLDLVIRGDGLPVSEAEVSAAAADLALSMPTRPAPDPQAMRLRADLQGLALGDAIWAEIDPSGALPREAATLLLDLEGTVDVTAPPGAAMPGLAAPDGLPGVLPREVTLNTLSLDAAGASLDAEGAFRIPAGPGGVPDLAAPVGALDLTGQGIPALLERLTGAGLLGPDAAMGAQMMLGMFAEQGPDGTLRTRIETTEDGGISVNGNRLR